MKSISAGLYHCNLLTEGGSVYSWGRGLNGTLGNGSNSPSLEPLLNEEIDFQREEDPENNVIVRMESSDEYTVV